MEPQAFKDTSKEHRICHKYDKLKKKKTWKDTPQAIINNGYFGRTKLGGYRIVLFIPLLYLIL